MLQLCPCDKNGINACRRAQRNLESEKMCHFCGPSASSGSIPIQCDAALTLPVHNFGAHLAMKTYSKAKFLGLDFLIQTTPLDSKFLIMGVYFLP